MATATRCWTPPRIGRGRPGLERVFLADAGAVAVEVALKLAVQFQTASEHPQKQRFLSIRGGCHGDTFAAMGVCDPVDGMHSAFPGLAGNVCAPRPPVAASATPETVRSWASELGDIAAARSGEPAAIIVEPVLQGAGGMHAYPAECLTALRQAADRHGLLLIFDEIATGFGRTVELFAADHRIRLPTAFIHARGSGRDITAPFGGAGSGLRKHFLLHAGWLEASAMVRDERSSGRRRVAVEGMGCNGRKFLIRYSLSG